MATYAEQIEIQYEILYILKKKGKRTTLQIAKEINLSTDDTHNKLSKLVELGFARVHHEGKLLYWTIEIQQQPGTRQ